MAKKLTTKEILEAARKQAAGNTPDDAPAQEQAAGGDAPAEKKVPVKPAASGAAPKSTKDILAAARAQSGKGAPASEASAGDTAAAKPAAAPAPAGDRPSVQEMLKAVREGKSPEAAEVKPTPAKPVLPPRPQKPAPSAKAKPAKKEESRRFFLLALVASPFALGWSAFGGTMTAWLLGLARYMMPNVLVEPPSKFKIGPPSDYPFGSVSTKWKSEFATWIVHTAYNGQPVVYALSTVCTHLGCTPNWLDAEQKYKCPCHGSGFYINGVNFEGPAPRPLERFGIQLSADGMLEVDKSMKFQEEMGQWEDPASFYVPTAS